MRPQGRSCDQFRPVSIERGFQPNADASILIRIGNTHVACGVTIEENVPAFLKSSGRGWITAEYGMLPCATSTRTEREAIRGRGGRTYEIQRLIGRSLRMMVDTAQLGERTLRVDCDVINADGGTRCAAITSGALAVRDAIAALVRDDLLPVMPQITMLAAISVGMVDDEPRLDLEYVEDSIAQADANFVMTGDGRLIEAQCTAEGRPLATAEFAAMLALARKGIADLLALVERS